MYSDQPRIDEFSLGFLLRLKLEPLMKDLKEFLLHSKEDVAEFSFMLFRCKEALDLNYNDLSEICSAPARQVKTWAEKGGGPEKTTDRVLVIRQLQKLTEEQYDAITVRSGIRYPSPQR